MELQETRLLILGAGTLRNTSWLQRKMKSHSPSHLRLWGGLGNDNCLPEFGFQVHLVVPMPEKLSLNWLHWFSILLFSLFREPLLGELLIFIFVPLSAKVQVFCLGEKNALKIRR